MTKFDEPIERLIEYFKSLPGVGYKTAQRYAYSVIEGDDDRAKNFAQAILEVKKQIHFCTLYRIFLLFLLKNTRYRKSNIM